jgi:hypothetical protein
MPRMFRVVQICCIILAVGTALLSIAAALGMDANFQSQTVSSHSRGDASI